MTKPEKALYGQCGAASCGYVFKVCDLPAPVSVMASLGMSATCPKCGHHQINVAPQAAIDAARAAGGRPSAGTLGAHPGKPSTSGHPVLEEGRLIKIEFELRLPAAATHEQIEEWLDLEMHQGGCNEDNPLSHFEMEPFDTYTITDTGMTGRRVEFGHQPIKGGTSYRVRYERTPVEG